MGRKGGGFYVRIVKSTGRRYMYDQVMFGLPEAVDFLRQHHVEEGETIQVIRKLRDSLIIGVQNERVALGKEIADRIQV